MRRELYHIASVEGDAMELRNLEDCVWEGPQFLQVKAPLKQRYGHVQQLTTLFTTFLEIPDSTLENILSELCHRGTNPYEHADWEEVYRYLQENIKSDSDWRQIR